MAQIVATYDTVSKSLVVTQDGQPVADVDRVMLERQYGSDEPKFYCTVTTCQVDPDHKTCTVTHMSAAVAGLVEESPVARHIAEYLDH